jgi:hypothetical protein
VNARLAGLAATSLAVLVLLASMTLGLRAGSTGAEIFPVSVPAPGSERVQVEILNGAGIDGLARATTDRLRARGFDVVFFGNAGAQAREISVVLDRGRNPEGAARVARELGIESVEVAIDTTLYLDATVILGPDWTDIQP